MAVLTKTAETVVKMMAKSGVQLFTAKGTAT